MNNQKQIEDLLDLSFINLIDIEKNVKYNDLENCYVFEIESSKKFDLIHEEFKKAKDTDIVTVRDLSISGHPVILKIKKRRFLKCSTTETEVFSMIRGSNQFTIRYEMYIYEKIKSGETHEMISRNEKISVTKIREIEEYYGDIEINKYLSTKKGENFPEYISIDEISVKKGHGDFYTIIYDLKGASILAILKGHSIDEIESFFRDELTEIERNRVKYATMDMWKAYYNVITRYFKNVEVVIDRFHVSKELHKKFDEIRKTVNHNLSDEEKSNLKGNRFVILKNNKNLTEKDKPKLNNILNDEKLKDIATAYKLKEEFYDIFEGNYNKSNAKILINDWIKKVAESSLQPLISFVKTLKNWFDEILNYFNQRLTNGIAEGINNKIKEIKRKSYGFTNMVSFKRRVMISFL